jgi:hypothetical protein
MSEPVLEYVDNDKPYLGGYLGLVSSGLGSFTNLSVTDNVPAGHYVSSDWSASSGSWTMPDPDRLVESAPAGGQEFLRSSTAGTGPFNSHLGDGSYSTTVKLDPGGDPMGWGGMNIANTSTASTLSVFGGGYIVYLRRNGSVGIYKGGVGPVVADVPSGLDPTRAAVRLRVVKLGASIQVYTGDAQVPLISFTDTGGIPMTGGFGVATEQASGTISDIGYAADDSL